MKKIEIDNSRKKYINSDKNIDISIIEIKPNKDGIYNYLEIYDINKKKEDLENKNKSIYILHYPNEELSVSYGLIDNIKDNKIINYYCNTEEGSSGSPILSLKSFKLIGIHGNFQNNKINYGTFIKYAINEFNKFNKNEKNIINEINIICKTNKEDVENIFGKEFVENNKNNIDLIINGNKNDLFNK